VTYFDRFGLRFYIGRDIHWFRFRCIGFSIKRTPLVFSERNGYTKYWRLPFGWRLSKLRREP